jgi:alkylation response protein AidB-like acyl-CoA dehydrogenase
MDLTGVAHDIVAAMRSAGRLDETLATGQFGDLSSETVQSVVAEAARFAGEVLAPLNRIGDRTGVSFDGGRVATAPGFADAYRRWTADGWNGIGAAAEWGGQAMPVAVQIAVQELWNAANPAFAVGPMLTAGAIEALAAHAEQDLQGRLIPRLVSGQWTATMNLTEPQAGSDLGAIKTRAERASDGTYRLFGQKIFITWGEHDVADNIVHMVLARLPDAPPGTKGISMFAVPKVLDDGTRNEVAAAGIEEKLGLHGAPTCTMVYGEGGKGAVGWRVGEEHKGLAAMFTMMNMARLSVGVQGVGVAAGATAKALAYARDRRQGAALDRRRDGVIPIVEHPDVQRMLAAMHALTAASRALCHAAAHAIDMSRTSRRNDRPAWADRAALLTPIAKAFPTDAAIEVANLAIQVHGGAGYIEETGAAQALRDARVFAIYEGTNGIQAVDLVTRKLMLGNGAAMDGIISEVRKAAGSVAGVNHPGFGATGERLAAAAGDLSAATAFLRRALRDERPADALAGATPYLRLAAVAFGGALLAEAALASPEDDGRRAVARMFAETYVVETAALANVVAVGGDAVREAVHAMLPGR